MKKVFLSGRKGKGLFTIVDDDDYERIVKYKWTLLGDKYRYAKMGYVNDEGRIVNVLLHRFIMNPKEDEYVDHIDGDGLNNTKNNLRICTIPENGRNRHEFHGKSKYKGVNLNGKNWSVNINYENKSLYLGTYTDEVDAALVYDMNAVKYFKEFACLNFPEKNGLYTQLNVGYSKTTNKKTSKYKGVHYSKSRNKWCTSIRINGKLKFIGRFDTEDEAHEAYLYAKSHKDEVINRR